MTSAPPPPKSRNWLPILLTASAVGMSVGFGTCGLALTLQNQHLRGALVQAGAILFFASLGTLALTLIVAAILGIIGAFRK